MHFRQLATARLPARLKQQRVSHVHGLPGDYNLKSLDELQCAGLKWIGSCNELNAAYAADGYARVRGLSALFTTYCVGELSAINGVAGSFSEHVPVVHVVASPARRLQNQDAVVHHSLGDGRLRVYEEIHAKVTVAQASLFDERTAPDMIDRTLEQCLRHQRPVYVNMPCDVVPLQVEEDRLLDHLHIEDEGNSKQEDAVADDLLEKIYSSEHPLLLVDRGGGVQTVTEEINNFVRASRLPTLTMPSGASMIDHSHPSYFGVHSGPVGQIDTMPYTNSSDLVLAFGPMFSDTQTLGWSTVPNPTKTITISKNSYQTPNSPNAVPISAKRLLLALASRLDPLRLPEPDTTSLGDFRERPFDLERLDPLASITQDGLYLRLNRLLRPNDILLLANATPIIGGRDLVLPHNSRAIVSGMWFSVGHMLPAAEGAALAQQESNPRARTILLDGDDSFQCTAQELSTIMRERLNVTIFIINNSGYAYERHIHGLDAIYNEVAPWDYLKAPELFGAHALHGYKIMTRRVSTWADLDDLLDDEEFNDGQGLKLIDVVMGKYDVPEKFRPVFANAGRLL